jgi:hypothetical protein
MAAALLGCGVTSLRDMSFTETLVRFQATAGVGV